MTIQFKITILAENTAHLTHCSEWGFSVFVDDLLNKKKFLFDTGFSGDCVLNNARELNLTLTPLDGIILSHGHYDHVYGVEQILKEIGSTSIYAHPALFAKRFSLKKGNMVYTGMCLSQKDLETRFGVKFHLYEEITEISPSVYMTGLVPFSNGIETISDRFKVESAGTLNQDTFLDDNSLVLDTSKGLVVILGCAHRGVVNILTHVKNKFQKPIWAIIGGTHLHKVNQQRFYFTLDYIRNENIQLIAPAHCTGIERIFELKNYFGDKVQPAFCGETFYI